MKLKRSGNIVFMWHDWEDEAEFPPLGVLRVADALPPTWDNIEHVLTRFYVDTEKEDEDDEPYIGV